MTTQTQNEKWDRVKNFMANVAEILAMFPLGRNRRTTSWGIWNRSVLDWAVFGCLVVGAVGIIKALGMSSPSDILVCSLGSVAAFGLVIYIRLRKS